MNDDERREEGTEEQVEDLEAPADVQDDVAGGAGSCQLARDSDVVVACGDSSATCKASTFSYENATHDIVVYEK